MHGPHSLSDSLIRPDSAPSGKFTSLCTPTKNRENSGKFITLKTDNSWIDYRALTKIGLPANIDGPYNQYCLLSVSEMY